MVHCSQFVKRRWPVCLSLEKVPPVIWPLNRRLCSDHASAQTIAEYMAYLKHVSKHHATDKALLPGVAPHQSADCLKTVSKLPVLSCETYQLGGFIG